MNVTFEWKGSRCSVTSFGGPIVIRVRRPDGRVYKGSARSRGEAVSRARQVATTAANPPERRIDPQGYVRIGARFEHRDVLAQKIGRPLRRGEVAHHVNGVRSDNRPENLELDLKGPHTAKHNRARNYPAPGA